MWEIINPKCVELKYNDTDDSDIEATYISEITAAFTTANARMRFYDLLGWLDPSRICYCDTDNVMLIYIKSNPLHKLPSNDAIDLPKRAKLGLGLSEWKSEMEEGELIIELVVGGAKSYSCKTNMKQRYTLGNVMFDKEGIAIHKPVIKHKGITMHAATSKIITFETMRDMVLNNTSIKSEEIYTFR